MSKLTEYLARVKEYIATGDEIGLYSATLLSHEDTKILVHIVEELATALIVAVENDNCSGTSCPKPMRAMCSDPHHTIRRHALSRADALAEEGMGK